MRMIAFVLVIGLTGALALAVSKPTRGDFDAEIQTQLLAQIDKAETQADGDVARAVLIATCKAGRDQCVRFIRPLIRLRYSDHIFYSRAQVSLGDAFDARCTGMASQILCRAAK